MGACLRISAMVLMSGMAFSYAADVPSKFDFADIHAVPPAANQFLHGGLMRGGRYELRTATLAELIKTAYGVEDDNVYGGPSWLEYDRFDLIAKTSPSVSPDAVKAMLQNLLAERFQLVVHKDTKPLPEYVLSVGKGGRPKLKESDGSGEKGCQGQPRPPNLPPGTIVPVTVSCHNMTAAEIA